MTDKKTLERWLDVLNYWADYIEELSYQYPKTAKKYEKFNDMIDEMYNLIKKKENIGFTIETQTAEGKFYGYVAEHPEEPGLPYYSEEPDDAIIFETMQDAQNWIDTNSEGTDFNFIIINKKD